MYYAPPNKEYGLVDKPCYFCGESFTVALHEHYNMCPDCIAVYTVMWLEEANCEHIKSNTPILHREPWYVGWEDKLKLDNKAYIKHNDVPEHASSFADLSKVHTESLQVCSLCGAKVIAEGW